MAAVSLFWDTNMAAVTSCENTLYLLTNMFLFSFRISHEHFKRARKTYILLGFEGKLPFFCCQKDCNNTKLSVVVDEVFLFIYECNSLVFCFTDRIAVFWMKRGLFL